MDAKETVRYLNGLKGHYTDVIEKKKGGKGYTGLEPFIEALNDAILVLQPPIGTGQMHWVYLPDADLMPYEHLSMISGIEGKFRRLADNAELVHMKPEEANLVRMALVVYRSVLIDVHKDKIHGGVKAIAEDINKAKKTKQWMDDFSGGAE